MDDADVVERRSGGSRDLDRDRGASLRPEQQRIALLVETGRPFVQDCYRWLAVREVAAIGELTGLAVRGLKVVRQMAFVGDDRDRVRIAARVEVLPGHCRARWDADHLG